MAARKKLLCLCLGVLSSLCMLVFMLLAWQFHSWIFHADGEAPLSQQPNTSAWNSFWKAPFQKPLFSAKRIVPAPSITHPAEQAATVELFFIPRHVALSSMGIILLGILILYRMGRPLLQRLEESEARTQAIIDMVMDGIITTNEQGRIESFNPAAQKIFRYPASQVLGKNVALLLPVVSEAIAAQQLTGEKITPNTLPSSGVTTCLALCETEARGNYQTSFPAEISVGQRRVKNRMVFTIVARDITDRKRTERETRERLEQLQLLTEDMEQKAVELATSNQELDDFTYIASHDLKEPLRGISSYCEILLEDYQQQLDDEGRRMLGKLPELCNRLSDLIDDLLAYSRIGRRHAEHKPVDLEETLDDLLKTLGPAIDSSGGIVRRLGRLPVVDADPTMVGAVFQNLITNGLKFNDSEVPTVEVGWLEGEPSTFYIRDNGIGISPQHHEAVFAMFRRLHSRKKYEGTGAGLTIVKKIVEAHGGQVWLESEPGCGTTFFFTLAPGGGPETLQADSSRNPRSEEPLEVWP